MDPFTTLPDEILEEILARLTSSEDFANCSKAHQALANILEPTKSSWLFYQVLPSFMDYLSRDDVLNCRLVCPRWKSAIDTFLEDLPIPSPKIPIPERSLRNWCFWPRTSTMIINFLRQTDINPENSFAIRFLRLGKDYDSVDTREELDDYWSHALLLLSRVGSRVHRCKFSFEETPVNLIYILRGCLSNLPCLKSLEISHLDLFGGSNRRITTLIQSLKSSPFPTLPFLEHLAIFNVPTIFFQLVLPLYADSLKVFEFFHAQSSHYAHYYEEGSDRNLPPMQRLESLHLSVNQEPLLKLPSFVPNLRKLVISCPQIHDGRTLGEILDCCKNSLKHLALVYRFTLGDKVGALYTESFPEMPSLQEIMMVNPSSDWLENHLSSGRRNGRRGFCGNVERLSIQWRARNLDWWLPSYEIPDLLPVPVKDIFCKYKDRNVTWAEISKFLEEILSNQRLWESLPKLQSCYLSGYSDELRNRIFNTVVERSNVVMKRNN